MTGAARHSLWLRLLVGSAAAVVVAMLLAGLFIANLYRVHTTDRFKSELDHHLDELIAMTSVAPDGALHVAQPLSDPLFNVGGSGLYWQVDAGDGRVTRSRSLHGRAIAAGAAEGTWREGGDEREPLLQRSTRVGLGDGRTAIFTIASARALIDAQIAEFRSDLTLSMIAVGLLLLGGAAALVRFGLAPVRRLGEEVDRLRHGEVDRLDPAVPAEFSPVVNRFNALLEGQASLIARARTESGNLAHNLRTPLALIIDEAEQLRLAGHIDSADFLLARCAVMQHQIDHHLARAAAAGTRGAGTLTEVAPLVEAIAEAMRRLHVARGLSIEIALPPGLKLPCDRGDLAEILSNLIDNACKWAAHRVIVAGGPDHVEVRDDGPGVPEAMREAVMTIGTRLDPSTPGTGLGLAATGDILRFYDARLELGTAPEGGLLARARFLGED